jgi:hypothetical protein
VTEFTKISYFPDEWLADVDEPEAWIAMNFKSQTAALLLEIARTARQRNTVVAQIRIGARLLVHGLHQSRAKQAKALRLDLVDDRARRVEQVFAIRDSACETSALCRSQQAGVAHDLRRDLAESKQSIIGAVESLRLDFIRQGLDSAQARRQLCRDQRLALRQDRSDRARAVVELIQGFGQSHRQMAKRQSLALASTGRERVLQMSDLRREFYLARSAPPTISNNTARDAEMGVQVVTSGQFIQNVPVGFSAPSLFGASSVAAPHVVATLARGKILDSVYWAEKLNAMVASRMETLVRASARANAEFNVPVDGDNGFGQRRFGYFKTHGSTALPVTGANSPKVGPQPASAPDSGSEPV